FRSDRSQPLHFRLYQHDRYGPALFHTRRSCALRFRPQPECRPRNQPQPILHHPGGSLLKHRCIMTWKRIVGWIGFCILALIVMVAVGGYFTQRSNWFHRVLISKIEQQASARTGAQVRMQSLALHLSSLSADVYGITVRGKEPESAPPLAEADAFTIRLKIVSLFDKKIDLSEIILRHPRVHVRVGKDS